MEGGFRDAELFDKPCSYAQVGYYLCPVGFLLEGENKQKRP